MTFLNSKRLKKDNRKKRRLNHQGHQVHKERKKIEIGFIKKSKIFPEMFFVLLVTLVVK